MIAAGALFQILFTALAQLSSVRMPMPNFLILGAPKSGTTSLWAYLDQHPEVFFPRYKEPNYFALAGASLPDGGPAPPDVIQALIHHHSVTDFGTYQELFSGADARAIGDASVRYLYYPEAAPRILETLPDARLIAILREPVSRLYSHYCMNVQYQLEPLPLLEALSAEDDRYRAGWGWDWHYVRVSSYAEQLKRYFSRFDRDQLRVFLYDDLIADPMAVFRGVCQHLGISDEFRPDMSKRGKVSRRPRNLALDRWLHWPNPARDRLLSLLPGKAGRATIRALKAMNSAAVPKLDPGIRHALAPRFREDILETEDLLGRRTDWITQ